MDAIAERVEIEVQRIRAALAGGGADPATVRARLLEKADFVEAAYNDRVLAAALRRRAAEA